MPALTQICLHALSLSQELSSGPSLLSPSDARRRSPPSRQPPGVIHEAPTAWPPRRWRRRQRPSGGRCGMASGWHRAQEPRPSRRHGRDWYWDRLGRHGGNFRWTWAAARGSPQKSLFYVHRACCSRPKCRSCRHVEPRYRDRVSMGVGRIGVEVGRVVCGHRPCSTRPWGGAKRAPAAVVRWTAHGWSWTCEFGVRMLAVGRRWSSPGQGSLP